jgi:diacylglycerol kinase family enzyme
VLVFHNPTAGWAGRKVLIDHLISEIQRGGWKVQLVTHAEELRHRTGPQMLSHGDRPAAVVAAGGDGTVRLVADAIPPEIPLAVFPLGTENLLAKYLQMTCDPTHLVSVLQQGRVTRLDAGRANGCLFLVVFSCGFDAEVVHRVHTARRGHIHHWSYAKPILEVVRTYRYPELRVSWDSGDGQALGGECSTSAHWAFVFNVPSYAAGLPIAPQANPFDGQLDIVTFAGGSLFRGVCHLATVLTRTHRLLSGVGTCTARRVTVDSADPVRYQLDGDPGGMLPVEIEVLPQRLSVLVPRNWAPGRLRDEKESSEGGQEYQGSEGQTEICPQPSIRGQG